MTIFAKYAPLYWGAGLPVIPLRKFDSPAQGAGKAPVLSQWTTYGTVMPSGPIREMWLQDYPDCNIGLPFGEASGLCAIDIDTDDEELVEAIEEALPMSPWVRVGKKGKGLIFKWRGQRNFKLRDGQNNSIVEFLGLGNQMVMPPSIHPDTKRPYVANANLWEVMDKIQFAPDDVEAILRRALEPVLGTKGLTLSQTTRSKPLDVVPKGERDIQMVRHAGYLARVVLGIDRSMNLSLGQALDHMYTWVVDFTSSSAGDDMDPNKGTAKLLEFLLKDVHAGKTLPEGWDADLSEEQLANPAIAEMREKNEIQRWTYTKARNWLAEQIEAKPADLDWREMRILELIENVARDDNFSEANFRTLAPAIQTLSGDLAMKKSDLLQAFKAARQGDGDALEDHEAIAQAVIEDMNREGELRFTEGQFWQWNGSCFGQVQHDDIYRHIARRVKGNKLAKRHSDYEALVKATGKLTMAPLADQLEDGINFANGFLDSSGELHDHNPKFGKTFTMPFDYVAERASEAHRWFKYLEDAWGDDSDYREKVMALQEAFAATMFGIAPRYQRAILLYGKPGTGKTTALEVLQAMMPPAAVCSIPPELWGQRFQTVGMVGRTLNVCGELSEESVIDGASFKNIVGGESRQTEFKGKDTFDFRPIAAHWFASNHLPRTRDTSRGFTRRWLIFDFNRVVPPSERVTNFHEVLIAEEREAIAAWAVQGLRRLLDADEYTLPTSHTRLENSVLRANNSVAAWLQSNDRVRPTDDPDASVDSREAFDQYIWYMKDVSRGYGVTLERFMQMMEQLGHEPVEYRDKEGVQRRKFVGLKSVLPTLKAA